MKLDVRFSESVQGFVAKMGAIDHSFEAGFGQIQAVTEFVGGDPYQGEYVVTPKTDAQTLPTKGKVMTDNVTVNEIPFFEVNNTSGGSTVFIAKEM